VLRRPNLSPTAFDLLIGKLDKEGDPLDRLAAAEVLSRARLEQPQLATFLQCVKGEALISPSVLLPALQRAAGSPSAPAILDYLADSLRTGWKPAQADLEKVVAALPAELRTKADEVRLLWKKSLEAQQARLTEFEPLLAGGNAAKGRQVFFGKKAACSTCHRIGTEGGQIGPDLTKLGAIRAGRDVLESILLPSATIAQGHDTYVVAGKDGRVLTGVISRQTGEVVVLRDSSGAEYRLHRDQIEAMSRLPTSLMPEGLDRAISREEFQDLLAFLMGLK
jgi:putative heme-binding domain-containing protein